MAQQAALSSASLAPRCSHCPGLGGPSPRPLFPGTAACGAQAPGFPARSGWQRTGQAGRPGRIMAPVRARHVAGSGLSASYAALTRKQPLSLRQTQKIPLAALSNSNSRRRASFPEASSSEQAETFEGAGKDPGPSLAPAAPQPGPGAAAVALAAGEDAAVFSTDQQSLVAWGAFFAVLGTVLAVLYLVWLSPETGLGTPYADLVKSLSDNPEVQMALMLLVFALVHSGGAALRPWAEERIGARAYRVLFAGLSLPLAVSAVVFFINHRYDGEVLWQVRGVPGVHSLVWLSSLVSFFFLYPSTFNLLEVAAVDTPRLHLWGTGIARVTRHPQMWGQLLWCLAHTAWIGSSFTATTSLMLCLHHAFGVWHGEQRLAAKYGEQFEQVKAKTSIVPFSAILEGRQVLPPDYYKEFLRIPYLGILAFAIGAYAAHPLMIQASFWLHW